jgi:hypothetical protein
MATTTDLRYASGADDRNGRRPPNSLQLGCLATLDALRRLTQSKYRTMSLVADDRSEILASI